MYQCGGELPSNNDRIMNAENKEEKDTIYILEDIDKVKHTGC